MAPRNNWQTFQALQFFDREKEFYLDLSSTSISKEWLESHGQLFEQALREMQDIESGAIANKDEKRMVGHYWLRSAERSPSAEIRQAIESTQKAVRTFTKKIIDGEFVSATGKPFRDFLLVGIGGSALGPQFLYEALGVSPNGLHMWSIDNTDPDGMARVLSQIPDLGQTLFVVVSKSGGTKETRNGMLIVKETCKTAGIDFAKNAVAVTGDGSALDDVAKEEGWLARFPMWDWVGGRTSVCSAVGLLPLSLQGRDIEQFLRGAAAMDECTRCEEVMQNPALLLAGAWYFLGNGKGERDMVVLPYKDSLLLFSRYLQQLVMESLGKERDRNGDIVHQGIAVYGNKGSTDQHAYVQQLRDGINNFFVTFIEVLSDYESDNAVVRHEVEPETTSADYLSGFLQGTRLALTENGRESITLSLKQVDEYSLGMLIALFERAVTFYGSFINVNAYHQPGVEAGKKAASQVIALQQRLIRHLREQGTAQTAEEIARDINEDDVVTVFKILRRLHMNEVVSCEPNQNVYLDRYCIH